jgi:beta-1,4-mannosyl-glycoprotein beta-1,4-N-acetylglucosaminyltransferase
MLPEAYTYRDLIDKVRIRPCVAFFLTFSPPAHVLTGADRVSWKNSKQSAVDIPSYVVEHPDELQYLLPGPGHCIREDAPPGS